MIRPLVGTVRMLFCCISLALAVAAHGQNVVLVDLVAYPTEGIHAAVPQTIKFTADKPANVTREPVYRHKPQYGVITLGDARDSKVVVVLDADVTAGRPYLYVDSNENGDLTDEPPIHLAPETSSAAIHSTATPVAIAAHKGAKLVASVPVTARYNIAGRGGAIPSTLTFTYWDGEVYVNREYSRIGSLTVGTHSYRFTLVDQEINGRFDQFKHEEDSPTRVTILVDKNSDGVWDAQHEAFDTAKPFRVGGVRFQIQTIDPRGTHIALMQLNKPRGLSIGEALADGADAMPFDAVALDGKTVQFPDDYAHRVVLLHFWAMAYPQSLTDMPNIVQVYNQFHGGGLDIIGINLDKKGKDQQIAEFCKKTGATWPQVYDGGYLKAEIATLYGVTGLPQDILVDGSSGKILAMGGELQSSNLANIVDAALRLMK